MGTPNANHPLGAVARIFQGQGHNKLFPFHDVRVSLHDDFENLAFHAQAHAFCTPHAGAPAVGTGWQRQRNQIRPSQTYLKF
jgi:hypothetical protein